MPRNHRLGAITTLSARGLSQAPHHEKVLLAMMWCWQRRHEAQILVGRESAIVIDKHCPGIEPQVLLNEGDIVRKYKEGRISKPFLDEGNGVRVVLLLQNNLAFHGNGRVSPPHVE